ncbi:MAG: hypothetical protein HY323_07320 [Betaproteobacteria bacterium]|nr:hypothetical protein [Betaproteobacteria bacterium]
MAVMVEMLVGKDKGNRVWVERDKAARFAAAGEGIVFVRHPETREWVNPATLGPAPVPAEASRGRRDRGGSPVE